MTCLTKFGIPLRQKHIRKQSKENMTKNKIINTRKCLQGTLSHNITSRKALWKSNSKIHKLLSEDANKLSLRTMMSNVKTATNETSKHFPKL